LSLARSIERPDAVSDDRISFWAIPNSTRWALHSTTDYTFERHYTIKELMQVWGWSYETIRLRICNERGVLKKPYRVPEPVARRIHLKYSVK
jgi:hypothetical protein